MDEEARLSWDRLRQLKKNTNKKPRQHRHHVHNVVGQRAPRVLSHDAADPAGHALPNVRPRQAGRPVARRGARRHGVCASARSGRTGRWHGRAVWPAWQPLARLCEEQILQGLIEPQETVGARRQLRRQVKVLAHGANVAAGKHNLLGGARVRGRGRESQWHAHLYDTRPHERNPPHRRRASRWPSVWRPARTAFPSTLSAAALPPRRTPFRARPGPGGWRERHVIVTARASPS